MLHPTYRHTHLVMVHLVPGTSMSLVCASLCFRSTYLEETLDSCTTHPLAAAFRSVSSYLVNCMLIVFLLQI